uniref:Uncharacterized protein n=1 Tax=Myoviridae sp. ctIyl4 TaxID=2825078 RepID=A0A8S5PKD6_9CAUD|nr:MAG TPA: hypothetical protein [Myoviridae sp. ctIyl4]DAN83252.1 MAG TPA: hypothetical protein [Caudoviricetes sp.]
MLDGRRTALYLGYLMQVATALQKLSITYT